MLIPPHTEQKYLTEIEDNPSGPLSNVSGKLFLANGGSPSHLFLSFHLNPVVRNSHYFRKDKPKAIFHVNWCCAVFWKLETERQICHAAAEWSQQACSVPGLLFRTFWAAMKEDHINFMLVLLLCKDTSSSRHRHASHLDRSTGRCVKLVRKTRDGRTSQYNFYKHIFYVRSLLAPWHCCSNSLCSGWATDTELPLSLRTIWVGFPYLSWSADVTDTSLCPCRQHFTYFEHCVPHLTLLPIKQLNYNAAYWLCTMVLAVITRDIPTADRKTFPGSREGNKLPRGAGQFLFLKVFKTYLDKSPEQPGLTLELTLLWAGGWMRDFPRPLLTRTIFYEELHTWGSASDPYASWK